MCKIIITDMHIVLIEKEWVFATEQNQNRIIYLKLGHALQIIELYWI